MPVHDAQPGSIAAPYEGTSPWHAPRRARMLAPALGLSCVAHVAVAAVLAWISPAQTAEPPRFAVVELAAWSDTRPLPAETRPPGASGATRSERVPRARKHARPRPRAQPNEPRPADAADALPAATDTAGAHVDAVVAHAPRTTEPPTAPAPAQAGGARAPAVLQRVQPVYPAAARRARLAGTVLLEARIDRAGRIVEPIRIVASVPGLDETAAQALRQWRFQPALDDHGTPIEARVEIPIRFVLR